MGRWTLLALASLPCAACSDPPERLSATGLYADTATGQIADGVRLFRPQYELWADGATKRRWLYLPPGTQIDTSNMDRWKFPVGTKTWKEFTRDGVRVETRFLVKDGPGREEWTRVAYIWNGEKTDAFAAPEGRRNVLGTPHDVPTSEDCKGCHGGVADTVIGVSAIQLDHALGDLDLATLAAEGLVSVPPAARYPVPGNDVEKAALGYLHANCGHCHNPVAPGPAGLYLHFALTVTSLAAVTDTPSYRTSIGATTRVPKPLTDTAARTIVAPGDPEGSLLYVRTVRRAPEKGQMPPFATELVDSAAGETLAAWIRALPAP